MSNLVKNEKNDKLKQQTQQIFNIIEKPIMEYIAAFLEETPTVIFKDEIPKESDPLILLPIEDYKKDKYLKFTLKNIDAVFAGETILSSEVYRINAINNIIEYDHVKESVGFLLYCIKSAYPSILASSMINNKPMVHVDLELNESNWSFYPVFNHELTIKKKFLEESLSKLMHMKQQKENPIPAEMLFEINKEFQNIIEAITQVKKDITPEIIENEKKINAEYANKPGIGIFVEEIIKSQLPKPKYNPESQKLQPISSQSYEDPV
jgi:hypothetical protein